MILYSGGGGAWTLYGVDAGTGHTSWEKNHPSFWLAVGAGAVFADNDPGAGVTAISLATGKRQWSYAGKGLGSIGRLFYYDGKIYTALYILDSRTGRLVLHLPQTVRAFAAEGNKVFLASDGLLEARDSRSDRVLWSVKMPRALSPAGLAVAGHYVFAAFYRGQPFFAHHGILVAFSTSDGRQVWQRQLSSPARSKQNGRPVKGKVRALLPFSAREQAGAVAYASDTHGTGPEYEAVVSVIVNRVNSKQKEFGCGSKSCSVSDVLNHRPGFGEVGSKHYESYLSAATAGQGLDEDPIAAGQGSLYVVEPDKEGGGSSLSALNAKTGKRIWSYQGDAMLGPPAVTKNFVYIMTVRAGLVVVDKRTGKLLYGVPLPTQ